MTNQRQIGFSIAIMNIVVVVVLFLLSITNLAIAWSLGIMYGFTIQRSRFCTVASIRDVFLIRNFSIAKGILLYLIITTVTFGVLYFISGKTSLMVGSRLEPVSIFTMIGAFIFGIGMVIAGGCTSGTLIRMGEGLIMQWWSFLGIVLGLLLTTWQYDRISQYNIGRDAIFLPDLIGLPQSIVLQVCLFAGVYGLFTRIEQRKHGSAVSAARFQAASVPLPLAQRFFRPWSYTTGAVFLAILTTLVFLWNKTWGITNGIIHLTFGLLKTAVPAVNESPLLVQMAAKQDAFLAHPFVPLVLAMIIGSLISALLGKEFRIRHVANRRFIASALAGGFLMGVGARLAHGCNISSVMSGIPSLSLHGWVFLLCMILGVWVGLKILMRYLVK